MKKLASVAAVAAVIMLLVSCSKSDPTSAGTGNTNQPYSSATPEYTATITDTFTITNTPQDTFTFTPTETATTTPVEVISGIDSYIQSNAAAYNYGNCEAMAIGMSGGEDRRALLYFDLTAHSGKTLVKARLSMRRGPWVVRDYHINIYKLTTTWIEGSNCGGSTTTSMVTWNTNGSAGWGTAGGDYNATAIGDFTTHGGTSNDIVVDLNTAAVQAWIDSPGSNLGLILINDTVLSGSEYVSVYSREYTSSYYRPRLLLDF